MIVFEIISATIKSLVIALNIVIMAAVFCALFGSDLD